MDRTCAEAVAVLEAHAATLVTADQQRTFATVRTLVERTYRSTTTLATNPFLVGTTATVSSAATTPPPSHRR